MSEPSCFSWRRQRRPKSSGAGAGSSSRTSKRAPPSASSNPVARSERYDDPAFRPWQDRCPTLAMNSQLGPAPLLLYNDFPQMPFHMSDGRLLDGYEYGTRNFKLYVTDIDNDAKNGDEVVFYSERAYSYWEAILKAPGFELALPPVDANWNDILPPEKVPAMSNYWGSNYKMVRGPACLAADILSPEDPYDYQANQPQSSLNGILTYRDKTYLFSWQPEQQELWEFRLFEVSDLTTAASKVMHLNCTFR